MIELLFTLQLIAEAPKAPIAPPPPPHIAPNPPQSYIVRVQGIGTTYLEKVQPVTTPVVTPATIQVLPTTTVPPVTLYGNVQTDTLTPAQYMQREAQLAPCPYLDISQQILWSKQPERTLKRLEREYPCDRYLKHLHRVYEQAQQEASNAENTTR